MVGHMGYGGLKAGYGMFGFMGFISFLFFLLLVALVWLVVSKALLNTRKFKMMKDFPHHGGKHVMVKHIKECTCEDGHEEHVKVVKKKK